MSASDARLSDALLPSNLNVALVHDWLNQAGGAENVLEEMVSLFGGAPIYTSIFDRERMAARYSKWDIRTSFLQHMPDICRNHQRYLPLYPLAFGSFDLSDFDLVLSNKSGFCHGVRTRPGTHVCYCLTPTRFLWQYDHYRERESISPILDRLLQPVLHRLRRWDLDAAQRVDHFVAISSEVQSRIRTIYGRESVVVHPPVDTSTFTPAPQPEPGEYFLIVSRLVPYKRIDLAVDAFAHLPEEKLLVVGEGRDRKALEAAAAENVTFLGHQPRDRIVELMRGCKAFLFPGLEDFGIAPVEAMSTGRPVIAFGGGGALDTVIPEETGLFFLDPSVESLLSTLKSFNPKHFDPASCRSRAEDFSESRFRKNLVNYLIRVATGKGSNLEKAVAS